MTSTNIEDWVGSFAQGHFYSSKGSMTDDESRMFSAFSLSGNTKKKKFEPKTLGQVLDDQLVVTNARTIATQTDWNWKKMALRWRNAKLMHARFLEENDFFDPDPERVEAATLLLREIAQQLPDLFNVLTYDELQELSDVLSNVGLKRTDAKTNLVVILNSIPLGSEMIKRLSTSTISTPFRHDSMESFMVGKKLFSKLPEIVEEVEGTMSQPGVDVEMESLASNATASSVGVTTRSTKVKKKVTTADRFGQSIQYPIANPDEESKVEKLPPKSVEIRRKSHVKDSLHRVQEEDDDLISPSNPAEEMILTRLMETDFTLDFAEEKSSYHRSTNELEALRRPSSRGSSLFTDITLRPATSFERHQYMKKQREQLAREQHDDDPSLYLFGRANKCVDTRDLDFDPYNVKRLW